MSSQAGEGSASPDIDEDGIGNPGDGNEDVGLRSEPESETDSFSRTKSPDFVPSGDISPALGPNGTTFQGYGKVVRETEEELNSPDLAPLEVEVESEGVASPGDSASTLETPDDTPSIKVTMARAHYEDQI
jgi:hypothetical protein